MNSVESPIHQNQKQIAIETQMIDTIYTDRVDGLPARVLKSKGATRLMNKKLNPLSALFRSKKIAKLLGFPWLKLTVGIMFSGFKRSIQMARMAIGFDAFKIGTTEGDNIKGVLPLGQVTGLLHDTPTVKQIIDKIVNDAHEIHHQLELKKQLPKS